MHGSGTSKPDQDRRGHKESFPQGATYLDSIFATRGTVLGAGATSLLRSAIDNRLTVNSCTKNSYFTAFTPCLETIEHKKLQTKPWNAHSINLEVEIIHIQAYVSGLPSDSWK